MHTPSTASSLLAFAILVGCSSSPKPSPVSPEVSAASPSADEEPPPSEAEPPPPAQPCPDRDACLKAGQAAEEAKDLELAEKMLKHACELESAQGCNSLALLIDEKHPVAGLALKRKACLLGSSGGCSNAAEHLRESDPASAVPFYTKACVGFAKEKETFVQNMTCFRGSATAYGAKLYGPALEMASLICVEDSRGGCDIAGVLYTRGLGVDQDLDRAQELFRFGCEGGDQKACAHGEKLTKLRAEEAGPSSTLRVANANITIGSIAVNGVTINDLECRSQGGGFGSLLAGPAFVKTIAKRKRKLMACSSEGEVRLRWKAKGGRLTDLEAKGSTPAIEACIVKALKGAKSTVEGTCAATLPFAQ